LNSICVFTSDIAALLGISTFDPQQVVERYLKKYDFEFIEKVNDCVNSEIETLNIKAKKKEVELKDLEIDLETKKITQRQFNVNKSKIENEKQKIVEKNETLEENKDLLNLSKKDYIEKKIGTENLLVITKEKDINKQKVLSKELIKKNIKGKDSVLFTKKMTSLINTNYGIEKEMSAIELFEKKENIKLNTSQTFYKTDICKIENTKFIMGGKVDGLCENYIVEVKNRTRCFFYKIREYEMVQIQMYMHILNYDKVKLVEKCKGEIRIKDVKKDDKFINEILKKLEIFCNIFLNLLNSENLKKKYYSGNFTEKQEFIYKYIFTKIEEKFNEEMEIEIKEMDNPNEDCLIDE
jgi:hypothetical protein